MVPPFCRCRLSSNKRRPLPMPAIQTWRPCCRSFTLLRGSSLGRRYCPSPPPLPSLVATRDGAPTTLVPTASAPSTAGRNCPLPRRLPPPPPPPDSISASPLLQHRFNFCKSPSFVKRQDLELEYREVVHLHRQQLLSSSVAVSPRSGHVLGRGFESPQATTIFAK
jgi:hypothetical protein